MQRTTSRTARTPFRLCGSVSRRAFYSRVSSLGERSESQWNIRSWRSHMSSAPSPSTAPAFRPTPLIARTSTSNAAPLRNQERGGGSGGREALQSLGSCLPRGKGVAIGHQPRSGAQMRVHPRTSAGIEAANRRLFVPENPPIRDQEVGGSNPPSSIPVGCVRAAADRGAHRRNRVPESGAL